MALEQNIDSEQNVNIEPEQKGEIKNILLMVDALEASYEKRLQDLQTEYQADIDQMLEVYKQERQQFDTIRESQEQQISKLTEELADSQKQFKKEFVEHKITRDKLNSVLSKLKAEEDLLSATKERIATAKLKIKQESIDPIDELQAEETPIEKQIEKADSRFARTKNMFRQVISGNKAKPEEAVEPAATQATKTEATKAPATSNESNEDGFSY